MVAVSTIQIATQLAQALQTVAEEALAGTSGGTPTYSYMEAGPLPAWDCCPALIVFLSNISEEPTNPFGNSLDTAQRDRFGRVNMAHLKIDVLRCAAVAEDGIPDVAAKNAVAAQVQEDAVALWTGVYLAKEAGTFSSYCRWVHFDPGRALPEQGGCVGWEMTVRAQFDGVPGLGS